MRVCGVGAGAAGLCAARHLTTEDGISTVVYEQTNSLGGTWVYTEAVDSDPDTGLPVHSSLYKSLRTNLPKEVMGFPDFPIPTQDKSYLPAADILQFLNLYADHFHLRPHLKFLQHVKRIEPSNNGWSVTVTDLQRKVETTSHFDAVMICNGHYHTPMYPEIPGKETFPGLQIHSHQYRVPDPLAGKTVVILGAGPSGLDIALEVATVAKQVIVSHHLKDEILTKFPDNLLLKPDVQSISGSTVTFEDGSNTQADVLFYCTGFKYNFPFLSTTCGVSVTNNFVHPLYKHLVHIHKPSMCFVGFPFYVCAFTMFDIQVRYFLRVLKGSLVLPTADDMLKHTHAEICRNKEQGFSPRHFHMMGPRQAEYYNSLTSEAGLPTTPQVLTELHNHSSERFLEDLVHFRDDVFRVLDDRSYLRVK